MGSAESKEFVVEDLLKVIYSCFSFLTLLYSYYYLRDSTKKKNLLRFGHNTKSQWRNGRLVYVFGKYAKVQTCSMPLETHSRVGAHMDWPISTQGSGPNRVFEGPTETFWATKSKSGAEKEYNWLLLIGVFYTDYTKQEKDKIISEGWKQEEMASLCFLKHFFII